MPLISCIHGFSRSALIESRRILLQSSSSLHIVKHFSHSRPPQSPLLCRNNVNKLSLIRSSRIHPNQHLQTFAFSKNNGDKAAGKEEGTENTLGNSQNGRETLEILSPKLFGEAAVSQISKLTSKPLATDLDDGIVALESDLDTQVGENVRIVTTEDASHNESKRVLLGQKQDQVYVSIQRERKTSKRGLKNITRPSPSIHLDEALAAASDPRLLPKPRSPLHVDLTYRNQRTLQAKNFNAIAPTEAEVDDTISLQSITAKHIRMILKRKLETEREQPLNYSILNPKERHLLLTLGYKICDPMVWAKALLEPRSDAAVTKLTNPTPGFSLHPPWFVLNYLLRRDSVNAMALRALEELMWKYLGKLRSSKEYISPNMVIIGCVRLIRHARDVWPQAIPSIVKMYTTYVMDTYLDTLSATGGRPNPTVLTQITFQCNRLLSILSIQGARYPYLAAMLHQTAQFHIIRKMIGFHPPLPLNREGHRSLTKVLLSLKKTPEERDWALLKARTWPPFKVSKTQFDESKDNEYGTSTAAKSIRFMQAYGYPLRLWDHLVQVHTGWHSDGSPTVQQRTMAGVSPVPTSRNKDITTEEVHAAEIRSTRTIPEAWAAFVKFDDAGTKWAPRFTAMFEKLLAGHPQSTSRPKYLVNPENLLAVPGDGTEIVAPPTSPREQLYLPTEPPNADGLLDMLISRRHKINQKLLKFLLSKAPSFEFALKALSASQMPKNDGDIVTAWTQQLAESRRHSSSHLDRATELSPVILESFVSLLVSFPDARELAKLGTNTVSFHGWHLRGTHGFVFAYQLVLQCKPVKPATWNRLLKGAIWKGGLKGAFMYEVPKDDFVPLIQWLFSVDILGHMDSCDVILDHTGFESICAIAHSAALAAQLLGVAHKKTYDEDHYGTQPALSNIDWERREAERVMREGPTLLRQRFINFVGWEKNAPYDSASQAIGQVAITEIPRYLGIPVPATLHMYARALGVFQDHEGIYSFVQWMVDAANSIHEIANGQLNGELKMRRVITAVRVFLECPSQDYMLKERYIEMTPANPELIHLVRAAIESVESWGGWASDKEVARYCRRAVGEVTKSQMPDQLRLTERRSES